MKTQASLDARAAAEADSDTIPGTGAAHVFRNPRTGKFVGAAGGRMAANAYQDPRSTVFGQTPAGGRAREAFDYFTSQGWTTQQSAGLVANLRAESNFRHNAVGDGGRAFGIAQWHPDRQKQFEKFAGKPIRESSFQEQLAFVNYELTEGNERAAGNRLRNATTASEAGSIVSKYYERPLHRDAEAAKRAASATMVHAGMAPADHARAPDRAAAPETPADRQRAANGKVDVNVAVTVADAQGRPRNDVKAEVEKAKFKPMPQGVW